MLGADRDKRGTSGGTPKVRQTVHRKSLALAVLVTAQSGAAQQVDLILPDGATEGLQSSLESASLAASLSPEDALAQDYVAAANADYRRILTGLYAQGYYGGTISILIDGREAASIPPLNAPEIVESIQIIVDPGPRFEFGQADIGPLARNTELPESFAPGLPARAAVIRSATGTAVSAWRDEGYPLAEPDSQSITAVHPDRQLNVIIGIDPGPQLDFGDVAVSGNTDVRSERILEIAGFIPGTVYSPAEIEGAATRLRRSGAFSSIAIVESEVAGPNGTLPLEIQVVEQPPRRIGFGLEYSTIEGLTASAFWLHRNLLGGAERFRIEGEVSGIDGNDGGIDYTLEASLGRPATFRRDIDLETNLTLSRLDEPTYFLQQATLEFGLTQYITDDLTYTAGFGFLTAEEETEGRTRNYTLFTLPLTATYERRDFPLNPTKGYFIDLDVTPFTTLSGDSGDGARFLADLRGYRSVGAEDQLTFALRLQAGSVYGADASEAPADFLFYSGGGGSVRGQPYQSLGLTALDGAQTGGTSFAGAQFELRYDITDSIGIVGFYDVATIGAEPLPQSGDDWHSGAGLGLRYDTGIGPIRLDVGTPASGDNAGSDFEIYIGIGQAF